MKYASLTLAFLLSAVKGGAWAKDSASLRGSAMTRHLTTLLSNLKETVADDEEVCNGKTDALTCNTHAACTWCKCQAVPSECMTLDQAKSLPRGVFQCTAKNNETSSDLLLSLLAHHAWGADINDYANVALTDLSLNRQAVVLTQAQRKKFPDSHYAFCWNDGDNKTLKWRPQGIAGIEMNGRKFAAVTWYGQKDQGYHTRGARLSIVDVTDPNDVWYRHILLLDMDCKAFEGMHAGGLAYKDGVFHVADSRHDIGVVQLFDNDKIKEVPAVDRDKYFNYRYIMMARDFYEVPIKPSFMSYDWSRQQILIGTFHKCISTNYHIDTTECMDSPENMLAWIPRPFFEAPGGWPYYCEDSWFSEMQGAASEDWYFLYVSSSWGRTKPSHLHVVELLYPVEFCKKPHVHLMNTIEYPPGLENLHLTKSSGNLWMLTEFGPDEDSANLGNNRTVFVTKTSKLRVLKQPAEEQ